MSILNRASDGLLSVLLCLRNALIAYGPQQEDNVLSLTAPRTLFPAGRSEKARQTLTRWTQLGFFVERNGTLTLSESIAEIEVNALDDLRTAILRLLMMPENNPGFATDGVDDDKSLASDCTRALAWMLAQDV